MNIVFYMLQTKAGSAERTIKRKLKAGQARMYGHMVALWEEMKVRLNCRVK